MCQPAPVLVSNVLIAASFAQQLLLNKLGMCIHLTCIVRGAAAAVHAGGVHAVRSTMESFVAVFSHAVPRRFRNPKLERVPREQQFRRVIDICKRVKLCHHCGAYNGTVK
jgi:hypothetical protein